MRAQRTLSLTLILVVLAGLLETPVECYPGGAPPSSCADLIPRHGGSPQPSESNPYEIELEQFEMDEGTEVKVTLKKADSDAPDFRGFILKALDDEDDSLIGQFVSYG